MYAYIDGELMTIKEDHIVIDVSGIGYEIFSPNPYRFQDKINERVKVYTYFYVREDTQMMYGFKEEEEKELFKKLLNVSGIGPKNALSIVGQTSAHDFAMAIDREDDAYLTKFPGVGKKTARQMVLDLKGKVTEWMNAQSSQTLTESVTQATSHHIYYDEAVEALKSLGYSAREINGISNQLKALEAKSTDDVIKKGLQLLMR
ncbi:Holliday junction branch migration protein RuvA [Tenuibacillus multivorans]|uniref:Holliday junction branch migration complex subunit RuvA n=1 Tax=Tenuibacillus multivorans TaxID=237069 RepID=A0A1G9ZLY2_9BACI|nr:Holliday junction branch migration protein RuvA [Tenuibacillus multivorans]GEL77470.1 Holliday junction ATP-dependent DNA helicase RuvA [Tenuibacillus multivorans]SDN21563.1 holliday junction DNA helicase RuvA [Tenuibacillus multivorans]